jgi:cell wall-associated NlpC family hydrolase
MGCSNIKLALYDNEKRQEYAIETRKAFANSDTGKEIALKNSIVETAQNYEGTRYRYGSIDPKQGFDCSGLVYFVAKKHKIDLPRSSTSLAASAPHIPWKKAVPGDLVFFGDRGSIHHVAIVTKNKPDELWVIHSTINKGVYSENVLASEYWKKRILFAVDFSTLYKAPPKEKS